MSKLFCRSPMASPSVSFSKPSPDQQEADLASFSSSSAFCFSLGLVHSLLRRDVHTPSLATAPFRDPALLGKLIRGLIYHSTPSSSPPSLIVSSDSSTSVQQPLSTLSLGSQQFVSPLLTESPFSSLSSVVVAPLKTHLTAWANSDLR
jgi:hypothetical protein